MKSILCITHKHDIDGKLCGYLFEKCYPDSQILYTDYTRLLEDLKYAIDNYKTFEKIVICDISLHDYTVQSFVTTLCNLHSEVIVIDHHKETESFCVNSKLKAQVFVAGKCLDNFVASCHWALFYLSINMHRATSNMEVVEELCDAVSMWDTHEWLRHRNLNSQKLKLIHMTNERMFREVYDKCVKSEKGTTLDEILNDYEIPQLKTLIQKWAEVLRRDSHTEQIGSHKVTVMKMDDLSDYNEISTVIYNLINLDNLEVVVIPLGNTVKVHSLNTDIKDLLSNLAKHEEPLSPFYHTYTL